LYTFKQQFSQVCKMATRELARAPQLGSKAVSLTVKLGPMQLTPEPLAKGLQELYRRGEFADVVLICAEQHFLAHRIVLAAQSEVFKEGLASPPPANGMRHEIRLSDIANPEAVKFMLSFLYQLDDKEMADYNPRTQEINRDVLRLARQFNLPGLTHRAMRWLAKDLTTGNVVERLSICEEFGLSELTDKILEQLTSNRQALAEVAHSPQIMTYPRLMQAMLQCAAGAPEPEPPQPKSSKRAEPEPEPQQHKTKKVKKG
jgi:hypothetical protein